MTNIVPITAADMRNSGTSFGRRRADPLMDAVVKACAEPISGSRVHRTYEGKVLVVIEMGLQHGFVFEPGDVVLDYVAAEGSHPRDPREMTMTITGTGRMAAVHELPGGVQDRHGNEQGNSQEGDEGEGDRKALEAGG